MKIFISWSGERSRLLAEALRDWLPLVINALDPWISSADITAGARWNNEVADQLAASRVGIFCLTQENLSSPWIHFEAGAIAKDVKTSLACTLLLGLNPNQVNWPLAQFQAKEVAEKPILELVKSINQANGSTPLLREDHLNRAFDKWWPDLQERIDNIPAAAPQAEASASTRPLEDMVGEILSLIRNQERAFQATQFRVNGVRVGSPLRVPMKSAVQPINPAWALFIERAFQQMAKIAEKDPRITIEVLAQDGREIEVTWRGPMSTEGQLKLPMKSLDDIMEAPAKFHQFLTLWIEDNLPVTFDFQS